MADEGDQIQMEHQSNAGKWILMVLAILVVAASGYAHYATHLAVVETDQRSERQPGAGERSAESDCRRPKRRTDALATASRHDQTGTCAAHRRVAAPNRKPRRARLEKEQKAQINAVGSLGEISGVKTDVGGVKTDSLDQGRSRSHESQSCRARLAIWACRAD